MAPFVYIFPQKKKWPEPIPLLVKNIQEPVMRLFQYASLGDVVCVPGWMAGVWPL